jgi:hypothetical protein
MLTTHITKIHINIDLLVDHPSGRLPKIFHTKILYAFLGLPAPAKCLVQHNLHVNILTILGDFYKQQSSSLLTAP